MFNRLVFAAALAVTALAAGPAAADTVTITSGTRGATIGSLGPIGESFVATDPLLTSFGFQFAVANAGQTDTGVTFSLLSGAGLTGAAIVTRTATLGAVTGRTPTWYDFDLTGTTLVSGQSYTALLSSASTRLALIFGPNLSGSGVPASGDAYLPGALLSTRAIDSYCTNSGACDANFRFTALPGAAAVPEPAGWAMLIGGVGLVGGTARARRRRIALA